MAYWACVKTSKKVVIHGDFPIDKEYIQKQVITVEKKKSSLNLINHLQRLQMII